MPSRHACGHGRGAPHGLSPRSPCSLTASRPCLQAGRAVPASPTVSQGEVSGTHLPASLMFRLAPGSRWPGVLSSCGGLTSGAAGLVKVLHFLLFPQAEPSSELFPARPALCKEQMPRE